MRQRNPGAPAADRRMNARSGRRPLDTTAALRPSDVVTEAESAEASAAGSRITAMLNRGLDGAVDAVHRLLPARYHPYFLFEDIGAASFVGVGFALHVAFGHLNPWTHAVAIFTTFLLYVFVYLKIKRRVTGIGARSAMQDSVLFVAPMYLVISWLLGQDMLSALDALAFSLLLAVAWMRVGCFVSGCCHGLPTRTGVFYRADVLRSVQGARLYTAAPAAGTRVFPLQLVESLTLFVLIGILWFREGTLSRPDGLGLAIAVIVYATIRFCSEFFRGHRHRPKFAGLSEAQLFCIGLVVVATVAVAVPRVHL